MAVRVPHKPREPFLRQRAKERIPAMALKATATRRGWRGPQTKVSRALAALRQYKPKVRPPRWRSPRSEDQRKLHQATELNNVRYLLSKYNWRTALSDETKPIRPKM